MAATRCVLLFLVPFALLAVACTSYEAPKVQSGLAQRETGTRQDCNAIMGTAFRNTEERGWFEANCSKWPAVSPAEVRAAPPAQPAQPAPAPAAQPAPVARGGIPGDSPQCASMRGRPYANEQERTWFLGNCIRPEAPSLVPAPVQVQAVAPPAVLQPAAPPLSFNPNAAACETLRRTPNPTDAQRRWYFVFCNVR